MVSFLKRRKSSAVEGEKVDTGQKREPAIPSTSNHLQAQKAGGSGHARPSVRQPSAAELAMPDLRFSVMNLDADVMSAGMNGSGPTVRADRPHSRQLQQQPQSQQYAHHYQQQQRAQYYAQGQHQHAPSPNFSHRTSNTAISPDLAARPQPPQQVAAPPNDARSPSSPKSSAAMYAPQPPKPDPRGFTNNGQPSAPPMSQVRLSSPTSQPVMKDKKQLKREEKERAAREKERVKQAAKDQRSAAKKKSDTTLSPMRMDYPTRVNDPFRGFQPPSGSRTASASSAGHTQVPRSTSAESQWTREPDPQARHMRSFSNELAGPPAQRLPAPHALPATSNRMRISTPPDTKLNANSAYSRMSRQMSPERVKNSTSAHATTSTQQAPSKPLLSSHPGSKEAVMTTSSSEGGNSSTSTTDRVRPGSSDTATSVEGDNANSFVTIDELPASAINSQPEINRPRPARDSEREERAQSRLSMTLDLEVAKSQSESAYNTAESSSNALSSLASTKSASQLPAQQPDKIHKRNESSTSKMSTFSAMLMASRPGGAADRSVDQVQREAAAAAEAEAKQNQLREEYYRRTTQPQVSLMERFEGGDKTVAAVEQRTREPPKEATTLSPIRRIRESVPVTPPRRRYVQKSMQSSGNGWSCLGVGDQESIDQHWRTVQETIRVAHVRQIDAEETSVPNDKRSSTSHSQMTSGSNGMRERIEYRNETVETHYNDLFEMLFTSTTPDVIARLLSHLDIGDIKALRQTSSAVRLAVGVQRESIVTNFLSGIGYRTWSHVRGFTTAYRARAAGQLPTHSIKDPCPLSISDVEAYLLGQDLLPEYSVVGQEFARNPRAMDPGIALLARATTRAHNRVLIRLRLQPVYKQPSTPSKRTSKAYSSAANSPSRASLSPATTPNSKPLNRHNSYYAGPKHATDTFSSTFSPLPPLPGSSTSSQSIHNGDTTVSSLPTPTSTLTLASSTNAAQHDESSIATATVHISPWKPGRAAQFRVWVPAKDPNGWLSDEELALCEQELYRAGIWAHIKRGDIVWDTAVGAKMNEGKLVFDGHYLRDLSYAFDFAGHLPSWLNVVMFSPSYWHNVIKSSMPEPIVYIDVTPWKEQILNSLRLVQDQVDTFSGNGARYRIAKWLYRTAANISHGQIISRMNDGLEVVDEGWHGRIVIEMDGTAEMAKLLVARCAGAEATPQARAQLLATVMGEAAAPGKNEKNVNGASNKPVQYNRFAGNNAINAGSTTIRRGGQAQTSAWAIMRERSRPGLIWIRPLADRERLTG